MAIVNCKNKVLGNFKYDNEQFEVVIDNKGLYEYLHYIGTSSKPTQPVGLKDYSYMFHNCDFEYIDLSDWDISEVEILRMMFCYCRKLNDISSLKDWKFTTAQEISYMFESCDSLKNGHEIVNNWDLSNIPFKHDLFYRNKIITVNK